MPTPGAPRRRSRLPRQLRPRRRRRATAPTRPPAALLVPLLSVLLTVALPAPPAGAEPERPGERAVPKLLTELRTGYEQAGAAYEAYQAAEQRLSAQRERVDRISGDLAATRTELAEHRDAVGQLAREQYRNGQLELPPTLRLLLSDDPLAMLHQQSVLRRAADTRATTLSELERSEERAEALAREARQALDTQQTLVKERKERHETARQRMAEMEELVASLTEDQLSEVAELEQEESAEAQEEFLADGLLGGVTRTPSAAGERALTYALDQLGKPYAWGAEGPDAFDCSGLTSQAWSQARRTIPRTSQQQWRQLPRVPLAELRPGDLVVYFPGATHVALYAGDGMVVQSPRPGGQVKVSPIAANPILGAVRPDSDAEPLAHYTPPELPDWTEDDDHTGHNSR